MKEKENNMKTDVKKVINHSYTHSFKQKIQPRIPHPNPFPHSYGSCLFLLFLLATDLPFVEFK